MEHFRRAIGLRSGRQGSVRGEVTELTVQETEDPLSGSTSYGRTISLFVLKTQKGTKTLKLDPTMYDRLSKEGVTGRCYLY
jgi:RuvB-like protein 1 (pontin 52)